MRRAALVLAVLVTVLAVAPAGGAQCDPGCEDSIFNAIPNRSPDDGDEGASVDSPDIVEAGSTGSVLP